MVKSSADERLEKSRKVDRVLIEALDWYIAVQSSLEECDYISAGNAVNEVLAKSETRRVTAVAYILIRWYCVELGLLRGRWVRRSASHCFGCAGDDQRDCWGCHGGDCPVGYSCVHYKYPTDAAIRSLHTELVDAVKREMPRCAIPSLTVIEKAIVQRTSEFGGVQ